MAGRGLRSRKFLGGLALVFVLGCAGAGAAWRERSALLSWLYVRCLARAAEGEREVWVGRVADLGERAVPGLLDCLTHDDARVCGNARAALERLTQSWGAADPRTLDLAVCLSRESSRFSPAGLREALELAAGWFAVESGAQAPPAGLAASCSRLVAEAAGAADAPTQARALDLCGVLLSQPGGAEALRAGRDLVRAGLHADTADNRLRAVRLALHPGMDLLEEIVDLLEDPSAEVRRAAVLAVGDARDAVPDDVLLPCLHDPDPQVRQVCADALGGRGLRPEYLALGRLLTDPRPATRLQVLDELGHYRDLDPGLWLRRLSHDPSPAVRVAAMRAMSQQTFADLSDRIDQMARDDQSPTVRQLAQFYLNCPRPAPGRPAP
jgi:hypothetical protein